MATEKRLYHYISLVLLHTVAHFRVMYLPPGYGAEQFNASHSTCLGDTFNFSCTVDGNSNGYTIWRVGGGSNDCTLIHSSSTSSPTCGPGNVFTARAKTGFGSQTSATSFTSTLSGTADPGLNGILVECFGPANNVDPSNRVGGSNLYITGW